MRFHIDSRDDLPLYAQLTRQLRQAIAAGQWPAEQPLPSVRNLVSLLKVNPQTVLRAYSDLEAEGLIERRQGQGTFVVPSALQKAARERQREVLRELHRLAALARQLGVDAGAIAAALSVEEEGA
jgi:DNA-binding transcriptional regulator YhcF (GntR family)